MKLLLTGDWSLSYKTYKKLNLPEVDFVLGNLETPFPSNVSSKRPKAGPHLKGNSKQLANLSQSCKYVFNLANNHMMDFGDDGLTNTQKLLKDFNIDYFGAGSLEESSSPLVTEYDGIKVAFIGASEKQYGAVTIESAGVRTYEPAVLAAQISSLKKTVDFVVVSIHSGAEMNAWPSPIIQQDFRALVDCGADIIHGHHSHIPQGWEIYNGKPIFYGLGNFTADFNIWINALTHVSVTPLVEFTSTGNIKLEVYYSKFDNEQIDVFLCEDNLPADLRNYYRMCREPLKELSLLNELWYFHSLKYYKEWYAQELNLSFATKTFIQRLRISLKLILKGTRVIFNPEKELEQYHYFSCLSHRHAIECALGIRSGEIKTKGQGKRIYEKFLELLNEVSFS